MSLQELQNYTFTAKYAKWNSELKRRENWSEAVSRVEDMMLGFYKEKNIEDKIRWAYSAWKNKICVGSQRSLQFGGQPVLKHNARQYNCCASYCDRLRFFQECMYLLMCGCGTGFSVQKHHIDKLPKLYKSSPKNKTFIIEDSIEGWSDAIGVLISSYFESGNPHPEYKNTTVDFDYSKIRPAGSNLSSSSAGKAPGPEPLKRSIEKIKEILDSRLNFGTLRPIDAYDITMHLSDAVLSGGIRRSATICIFSKDDEEMYNAKTGDWFYKNPQRGRSNNSALLLRDTTTLQEFEKIIESTKSFGEPGFIWADSTEQLFNPCQPAWAKVLTPEGIREFKDIDVGSEIWSESGWTKVVKKWSTGTKPVFKYKTTAGIFYGTENHRILQGGEKIEVKDAESIDILAGPTSTSLVRFPQIIMDGIVLGDGSVHIASNDLVHLFIGQDDQDYFDSEISELILRARPGIHEAAYEIQTNIKANELPLTYNRRVPERYLKGTPEEIRSFLRGLYSANGSVCGNRITLKAASLGLIEDVQLMLSSIGIRTYITTNKENLVLFKNGEYKCRESYDLNITVDRNKFVNSIGFIQKYKNDKISLLDSKPRKNSYEIISIEKISEEEVFDITVDNESHTYWTQGCNVSNCVEAALFGYDEFGNSGWQFCNLTSINGKKVKSLEDFLIAVEAAAIIGTLQAGFLSFPYLGEVTERITAKESLLGISITGIMDSPDILLNPENQRLAALKAKEVNEKLSKELGINPAARLTNIKPEGTTSCVLGTASGIHPHHAKRYIRRVQANKLEEVYQYFRKYNPKACESSVWSNNDSDDVISFCIEVEDGAKTKNQVSAIDLLQNVMLTQQNWVKYGTVTERLAAEYLQHNVSNTINVKPEEWETVTNFIYENRKWFAGISILPVTGDKDYPQAPFTTVYLPNEMVRHYGDGIMFVSGLIDKALELWEDNLWVACDSLILNTNIKGKSKQDWIKRCERFAIKYFGGELKKLTYAMKDVYNYKLWTELKLSYNKVDYSKLLELTDNTKVIDQIACAGGKCEF